MGQNTDTGFTEYRHVRCKHEPFSRSLTFYFDVNQELGFIKFAFSACSTDDNFSREIGRKLAKEHFDEGRIISYQYDRELSLVDNAINAMNFIADIESDDMSKQIELDALTKKTYEEILRALEIYNEVDITNSLYNAINQGEVEFKNLQLLDDISETSDGC